MAADIGDEEYKVALEGRGEEPMLGVAQRDIHAVGLVPQPGVAVGVE